MGGRKENWSKNSSKKQRERERERERERDQLDIKYVMKLGEMSELPCISLKVNP